MGLLAFITNIWTGFSPAPRRRRTIYVDPDSIEPINHWFPGNRNIKQPRRLVETPTAGHWPEYRVAKKVVGKGRKRCATCGALVKEAKVAEKRVSKKADKKAKSVGVGRKEKKTKAKATAVRSLRGRNVEYSG